MSKYNIPSTDVVVAKTLDVLSAVVSRSGQLERLFIDTPASSQLSTRWHMARTSEDGLPREAWPTFPGDARSGRLARNYRSVGLIGISKAAVLESGWYGESVHAVAYPIGKATMVAALPEGITFGEDDTYPDTLLVGMGIGRGPLRAAMGLWYPDTKKFVVPTDSELRPLDTYDTAVFPSHIPKP